MQHETEKKIAAAVSIASNTTLIAFKLIAGFVSGSISVISEAIHSMSDLLASALTFFAVIRSSEPPDKVHQFGHGRYEDFAGFLEGCLILLAAIYIIFEAVDKLISGHAMESNNALGITAMSLAIVANFFVSKYLYNIAAKTGSVSLYADAEHLRTDIISSAGVLFGLILIKFTGLTIFDSIIALIVAFIILKAGLSIARNSLNNLLDCALPDNDIERIQSIINLYPKVLGCKGIKSRRIGPERKFEIILQFDGNMPLYQCHDICNLIEKSIKDTLENTTVVIHQEPLISTDTTDTSSTVQK